MRPDADRVLEGYLAANPEALRFWLEERKLKNDPRITRVGKFLRKSSLDELPQVINILLGDMSLVGPRPVTEEELAKYGQDAFYYLLVRPGLTGLWQVSGRNEVSYEKRVALDRYYVQNWSIWLDLYILARTVWVVLTRKGAY
jgi:lipopolysaccharide/colanic/teichoic acid biosynthesis glycosyltransferase